jgi:hypothetical protein
VTARTGLTVFNINVHCIYIRHKLPIATKIVSSNPVLGEVYWIQHYVKNVVSVFGTGSPVTPLNYTTGRECVGTIFMEIAFDC